MCGGERRNGTAIKAAHFAEAYVTHSFKFAALAVCSIALSGAGFAEDRFQVKFRVEANLSTEANYAAFERTAAKACAVDRRHVSAATYRKRIEADCEKRLMSDAIAAIGKKDLTALHQARTGTQANIRTASAP